MKHTANVMSFDTNFDMFTYVCLYICPHCGRYVRGNEYHSCTPHTYIERQEKKPITGWKCPVCGKGIAPWVKSCNCINKGNENGFGSR